MVRNPLGALLVSLLPGLVALPAVAQKPAPAPASSPKLDLSRLKRTLETGNEAEKLGALAELAEAPKASAPSAAQLLNELLARGASAAVLEKALEAEQKLAQPSSSPAIVPYVRHRNPTLRRAAARALAATGGPVAVTALRGLLRGSDPALRRQAARSLAALDATEAVDDLFAVLGKEVPEAAGAIGKLCKPSDCQKLVDLLGRLPFDVMQTGLEPMLLRPDAEVPEGFKLELLERLRKLQTQEVSVFLKTLLASFPKDGNVRVKAGIENAASGKPVTNRKP
ncbi:MAG TPA: HEAT repeat domain-containing protein [Polyangiaceae bacterium]|nr:HEAT repeat domain-containing protein [Polyangiaceae bacterium]